MQILLHPPERKLDDFLWFERSIFASQNPRCENFTNDFAEQRWLRIVHRV